MRSYSRLYALRITHPYGSRPMIRSNLQPVSGKAAPGGAQRWRGAVAAMDDEPKLRAVPKAGAVQPDLGVVGDTATLDGVVERITYRNEANGYTIAKLKA